MKKIIVGIHRENQCFETRWAEELKAAGVEVKWLDLLAQDGLKQAQSCDGIMWHYYHCPSSIRRARTILHVVETELGIPVFPDLRTSWHFDDKVAQYYLMQAHGLPMPKTWVFWRREDAEQWATTAPYPIVLKLSTGAGSSNVLLVNTRRQALNWIRKLFGRSGYFPTINSNTSFRNRIWKALRRIGGRVLAAPAYVIFGNYPPLPGVYWLPQKDYAYFQEFLEGNEFDIRVTVIGKRAFAYRRMNRPNDFRASGSGLFDVNPEKIDLAAICLALKANEKLGMQSMACDILYHPVEKRFVITEISYGFVDWMVAKCPGYWDLELQWHDGHMWPQKAHVEDFLTRILKKSNRV